MTFLANSASLDFQELDFVIYLNTFPIIVYCNLRNTFLSLSSSISIIWKFVRNANLGPHPTSKESGSGDDTQRSVVVQVLSQKYQVAKPLSLYQWWLDFFQIALVQVLWMTLMYSEVWEVCSYWNSTDGLF